MRRITQLIVLVAVVAVALPAAAKGAIEATITGPGIDQPIVLDGRADIRLQDGNLQSLMAAVSFWDLTYTYADSPHRPAGITMTPPTARLGPEFVATIAHHGPGGTAYVDVFLYPEAEGGPLAHVKPDVEIEAMGETTSGGWLAVKADLSLLLEKYGVDMALAMSETSPVEPPGFSSPVGWLIPLGLVAAVGLWAVGRRPRRPVAS